MDIFGELADNEPLGCSLVVGAPRKLMRTNWTIQSGQSLTSRPEQISQNFSNIIAFNSEVNVNGQALSGEIVYKGRNSGPAGVAQALRVEDLKVAFINKLRYHNEIEFYW